MATAIITIEASANYSDTAPTLEILVGGVVFSSSIVTATTGVGSDILSFTIDFPGSYPSSLSFRFNDGSAEPGRSIAIESVRINGNAISNAVDLTPDASLDSNGDSSDVVIVNTQQLFSNVQTSDRNEPTLGDFGTPDLTGTGGADTLIAIGDGDVFSGLGGNDNIIGSTGDDKISGGGGDDYIRGGAGNDIIIGEAGVDTIVGGLGNDLIYGGNNDDNLLGDEGDDVISGGAGNDTILGGDGKDVIYGEAGNDFIVGADDDDIIYGDGGSDSIGGGDGDDLIYGGDDDDMIVGDRGNDTIYGDDGNDQIDGLQDDDTIYGGDGDDALAGNVGNDTIYGGNDNDYMFGDQGNDNLNGDAGNDTLLGGTGTDTLNGGAGNDILHGHSLDIFSASMILFSNPGISFNPATNSFYQLVSSSVTFAGAQGVAGATMLDGVAGHLVTIGSAFENSFVQTLAGGNEIWINASDSGVEGEWRWSGGSEDGQMFYNGAAINGIYENWNGGEPNDAGAGEDAAAMRSDGLWNDLDASNTRYYVIEWDGADFSDDNSVDTLNGGANDDQLYGDGGNDILNGDAGADYLAGGAGNDDMDGGADNDYLYDFEGANEFYGGNGTDVLDARFQTNVPSIANQISTVLAENPSVTYSVDTGNFYQLVNNQLDWDQARSAASSTILNGLGGHLATITTQEEHDFIVGLAIGVNTWLGGSDDPTITGGAFDDWYWVEGPEAGTHFSTGGTAEPGQFADWNPGQPNDSNDTQNYLYLLNSNDGWADLVIEGDGSTGFVTVNQYLVEWEGADMLIAPPTEPAQSAQHMEGGAGNDTIYGSNAGDTIYGDDAADTLSGNDYIEAGDGDDTVNGGQGADEIYGGLGSDILSGGDGNDNIYAAFAPSVSAIPLNTTFDTNEDGWSYADGFAGVGGSDPANITITGSWNNSDGYSSGSGNGSLDILFDTTANPTGPFSGNYSITVNLATAMDSAQLSFAYRMFIDTGFDNNEDLFAYADIDGTLYGANGNNWFDERIGNSSEGDSGWRTTTLDIGALSSGSHTIMLGAYVTDTSTGTEDAWIRFDDVVLQNNGSSGSDSSSTNILNGGDGNDTLYGSDGIDTLNGGNGDDILYSASVLGTPAFTVADALAENTNATYNATTGNFYEYVNGNTNYAGAVAGATASTINGVAGHLATITSATENAHIQGIIGNSSWLGGDDSTTEDDWYWNVGPDAGTHFSTGSTAESGQYANWAGGQPNDWNGQDYMQIQTNGSWADFDQGDNDDYVIEWEGNDVLTAAIPGNITTMNGGDGSDTLYGSDGTELFVFEDLVETLINQDTVHDFDESQGDILDISDLLSGLGVVGATLSNFVDVTSSGVKVNVLGTGGALGVTVVNFNNATVTDEATLYSNSQLII